VVSRILVVVPSLAYGGTSKQLLLLATALPRSQFEVRVAVLGEAAPFGDTFRAHGIEVTELGWRRLLDFGPLRRLCQMATAFQPDVVHAWHLSALRAVVTAGLRMSNRVIASRVIRHDPSGSVSRAIDRWLLRYADYVVVANSAEATQCRHMRIPERKMVCVPPAVSPVSNPGTVGSVYRSLGIPEGSRLLLAVGPFRPGKGFRDTLWAFDILHYLDEEMRLLLIGGGPERDRLERFARAIGAAHRVHFLGSREDLTAFYRQATAVWVPSCTGGGVNVALEAMAAGRPVVACRLPALAEIIADGATGFLIDPGDRIALARKTRLLLNDPERGRQLGEAGRNWVESQFSVQQLAKHLTCLYEHREASSAVA
jgi:glycosyltransferase involved in cell wall biosynthesis